MDEDRMYQVLNDVFKHKQFKSDLQRKAVETIIKGIYYYLLTCLSIQTITTHSLTINLSINSPRFC